MNTSYSSLLYTRKTHREHIRIDPLILLLGTEWRGMVVTNNKIIIIIIIIIPHNKYRPLLTPLGRKYFGSPVTCFESSKIFSNRLL